MEFGLVLGGYVCDSNYNMVTCADKFWTVGSDRLKDVKSDINLNSNNIADGYQKPIHFFVKKHCLVGSTVVKQNDFGNFNSYLVQKGVVSGICLSNIF
jgi:hypothetical protein